MLGRLRRILNTLPPDARLQALETHVKVLYERITEMERAEMVRSAEHHDMLDKLDRLYKRLCARMQRGGEKINGTSDSESPLALRTRLGR